MERIGNAVGRSDPGPQPDEDGEQPEGEPGDDLERVFWHVGAELGADRRSLVLNPTFGPVVSTVYGWFGSTITPRWDLDAYTVRQLGVESEGSDASRLRVRLSVQNDSDRVQPLPLVRLTLTDRFDKPVATRDLQPREYLPPKIADRRLLEPNQRIDGELHVIDPGRAAVGFEIDACLRSENGQIGCANQLRRTTD